MRKSEQKMLEIYESYLNGNISWVKSQVKKMRLQGRKDMYNFIYAQYEPKEDDINFFFNLI